MLLLILYTHKLTEIKANENQMLVMRRKIILKNNKNYEYFVGK